MAIIFAARSDNASFNARYGPAGITPALMHTNVANIPTYDVDATAIGGSCYNLAGAGAAVRGIVWPAYNIFATKAFSILMRLKFPAAGTYGLLEIGSAGAFTATNYILMFMVSDYRLTLTNETPATAISSAIIYATPPANDTWVDVVLTWTGLTTANAVKLWVDGSNVGSLTAAVAGTDPRNAKKNNFLSVGGVPGAASTRYRVNEVVVWNEVINPAAVGLTGGTGSLEGAARTTFVDVASFDGTAVSGSSTKRHLGPLRF
jgi:hypothetical protein